MLTFLRKIRRSLVVTDGAGKYLIYALGEIALVVIGILIALQINNWNQYESQKRILESHLNTVLENLKNDKTQLESLIDYRNLSVQSSKSILDKHEQKKNIEPREFMKSFLEVALERKFDRHNNGFERLQTSDLFQNDDLLTIRGLMAEYSKIIEEISFWEYRFNTFTESIETELFSRGFFDETLSYWRKYANSSNNTEELGDTDFHSYMEKYPLISSHFFRSEFTSESIIGMYKRLIGKGTELSAAIENHMLND